MVTMTNEELTYLLNIGANLKTARQHAGLSLRQASKELHILPSNMCKYEKGKLGFSVWNLHRMANKYGVDINALFMDNESFINLIRSRNTAYNEDIKSMNGGSPLNSSKVRTLRK